MSAHPFLQAGDFNTRLEVQQIVQLPDGCGGFAEEWQPMFEVWARIIPISGILIQRADRDVEELTHRIYLRRRNEISAGMRFVNGNRQFRIESARDPDETGRYLLCEAKELQ